MIKTVLTTQEWVKFYQDNPAQLATFIETANEEYQKLADKSQDQDSRIAKLETMELCNLRNFQREQSENTKLRLYVAELEAKIANLEMENRVLANSIYLRMGEGV